MKRIIAMLLCASILFSGCSSLVETNKPNVSSAQKQPTISEDTSKDNHNIEFASMSDPKLIPYLENAVYSGLVSTLESEEYFVENIQAIYVSQEYIDEVSYNSKSNVYFGYTLSELDAIFQGTRYVFTLGEDGKTTVKEFETYDDTYAQILKNVAIGTGVILLNATITILSSAVGAYTVSVFFASATKESIKEGLVDGLIVGLTSGIIEGIKTKNFDSALKEATRIGSEAFKWGAIGGTFKGGIDGMGQLKALKGATLNGLTLNQAAKIQMESKYPVEIIKSMHSMKEYEIFKNANLKSNSINGKWCLVRDIDWDIKDSYGRTNKERIVKFGLSPIDSNGKSYEIHHIGQMENSPLAILTYDEHKKYYKDLHKNTGNGTGGVDHNTNWSRIVKEIWTALVNDN